MSFLLAPPDVNKESYQPATPTLFGEVRVSKQLLDHDLQQETRGFRAGYLRYPSELLRVLEDSGYLFDSSVSAQYVLTNFPYFGFRRRTPGAEPSNIVVVPVTLDDSRDFLTQQTQEHALRTWLDIIHANSENGASTCLLIHPTDTTYKLETERRLIEALRGSDTWIGDVGSLARFWRSRARLRPVVKKGSDGGTLVVLNLSREELPSRLAVVVESTSAGPSLQVVDTEGRPISVSAHESGDRVLIRLP